MRKQFVFVVFVAAVFLLPSVHATGSREQVIRTKP